MSHLRRPGEETFAVGILQKYNGKPGIPGFLGNLLFYLHNANDEQKKYPTNDRATAKFETDLTVQICQNLLFNNVEPHQIQVMSNSGRRLRSISKTLDKCGSHSLGLIPQRLTDQDIDSVGNKITIAVLVKAEADWDEEVMVRTISKGINNSSDGIIIIGRITVVMEPKEPIWTQMIDSFYRMGCLAPYISLYCEKHNLVCTEIKSPSDIHLSSPKGGCLQICCDKVCQHFCDSVCHPRSRDHDSNPYLCKFPCEQICPNGHPCQKICFQKCRCEFNCIFTKVCGHPSDKYSNLTCRMLCDTVLPCGHTCKRVCHKVEYPNHEDLECIQPCNRRCQRQSHTCAVSNAHSCGTPCTPCMQDFELQLDCGHYLKIICSENGPDLDNYVCHEVCRRRYALCNHPCKKKCFEECGVCEKPYPRKHPTCGHKVKAPCNVPIEVICRQMIVPPAPSRCGHEVTVPCFRAAQMPSASVAQYCYKKCDTFLILGKRDCGHYCYGSCWDCYQGRLHQRCAMACGKILICGHECQVTCSQVCPPCNQKCMNVCEHYECPFECGVPCDYNCEEPCNYECVHLKCTKKCGEVCDRTGCEEPCPKLLPCGHPCVGYCGEACSNLCRICNPDELLKVIFTGISTVEDTHRFIYLTNCGHTIEDYSMSAWIATTNDSGEIQLKCCPLCRKPIVGLRRFSEILLPNLKEVTQVKTCIYGKENTNMEEVEDLRQKIRKRIQTGKVRFLKFGRLILTKLSCPMKSEVIGLNNFHSMYKDKVSFAEWVFNIWARAEDQMSYSGELWPGNYSRLYGRMYGDVFGMLAERNWPMHPNEVSSIGRELTRIKDAHMLYRRLSLDGDENVLKLANSREGKQRFNEAHIALRYWAPYTKSARRKFREAFDLFRAVIKYTLDISENEREQIIQAFGARAGRWFKCPNGHVYVVTECGGPTQVSQCSECGEQIGGQNHVVLRGNTLATEMDGAELSMYPTALIRPPGPPPQ